MRSIRITKAGILPVYGKTMPGSVSALQNQFSGLANLSCTDGVTYKATSSDKKNMDWINHHMLLMCPTIL